MLYVHFFCQNDLILHKQLTLDLLLIIAKVHVLQAEKTPTYADHACKSFVQLTTYVTECLCK